MPQFATGTLIDGRYRLGARLDSGGLAEVWSATDEELGREVAIKITPSTSGGAALPAARSEVRAEAALNHPNIVEVFDSGQADGAIFVVMELLEGQSVDQHLESAGPYEWPVALRVGRQLASALVSAHSEGIAHGRIGPSRVVVSASGEAKLTGFGERCEGDCERPFEPDADTYALGALLFEMLAGVSPFAPRPADLPDRAVWPPALHTRVRGLPTAFERAIMRAISPDPSERYSSAAEMLADLDAIAAPRNRRGLIAAAVAAGVLAAVLLTWFLATLPNVVVPDVSGHSPVAAAAVLQRAGLRPVSAGARASTLVATGTIAGQNPPAGSRVRSGTQVALFVSSGVPRVAVPSVVGVTLQAASARISAAGLSVGTVRRANSATYPVDVVMQTFPAAEMSAPSSSAVDLVVSAGQATVTMPDVRAATRASALAQLRALGLTVDVGMVYSRERAGLVVSQSPDGGATVAAGDTVVIAVSRGPAPVTVPDLVGTSPDVASTTLLNMGLVPVQSTEASGTDPSRRGIVVSTQPSAGQSVAPGTQVTVTIGN